LEIIIDLPFGFPINNIISQDREIQTHTQISRPRERRRKRGREEKRESIMNHSFGYPINIMMSLTD